MPERRAGDPINKERGFLSVIVVAFSVFLCYKYNNDPPALVLLERRLLIMNKSELIAAISASAGLTKKDAAAALDAALNAVMTEVAAGNKVSILGFGTFEKRHREARTGRNPRTGEATEIPASDAPVFKAGKGFKEKVNQPAPKKKKASKKKQTKEKKN